MGRREKFHHMARKRLNEDLDVVKLLKRQRILENAITALIPADRMDKFKE